MFPTLGCGVEQALRDDIPATMATLRAFNRWLDEDWGFSYQRPDRRRADAVARRPRRRGRRARLAARARRADGAPAPGAGARPPTARGRSLGDPAHDPVWARLAEADVPVAFHLGDSGYEVFAGAWGGTRHVRAVPGGVDVLSKLVVSDRPIHDTIGSLVVDGVFDRHPTLRVASIENGSDWVHAAGEAPDEAGEPDAVGVPRETRSTPSASTCGSRRTTRRTCASSPTSSASSGCSSAPTGPTARALAEPTDFVKELHDFSDDEIRLRHARQLPGLAPRRGSRVTRRAWPRRDRRRRSADDVDGVARRALGPRPLRGEWWELVGGGRLDGAALPDGMGRARLLAPIGRSRCAARSSVTAPCCRRAASGC